MKSVLSNKPCISLRTGSQRGRKKIRRASEWEDNSGTEIMASFRPIIVALKSMKLRVFQPIPPWLNWPIIFKGPNLCIISSTDIEALFT